MFTRLISFCLLAVLAGPAFAADDLPPDAKKLVEEHEKASDEILKKAEEIVKKAEEENRKAQAEVKARKDKLVAQLEELAKHLEKQGKLNQARAVAEQAEELRTGRIAGAQPDPGTLTTFRGMDGKVFVFEVTGNAGAGTVWGTDIYTDDSALAASAVHAGILKAGEKGAVKVTIIAGQASYTGSARNGVTTNDYGAWGGSYKVEAAKGIRKPVKQGGGGGGMGMADPGTLGNFRGQNGKSFLFEVTGNANGSVWGTGIYTDDSALATAAVHAGVLKAGEKGLVKVTILAGEPMYPGSAQNGVTSSEWGEWNGSYRVEAVKK